MSPSVFAASANLYKCRGALSPLPFDSTNDLLVVRFVTLPAFFLTGSVAIPFLPTRARLSGSGAKAVGASRVELAQYLLDVLLHPPTVNVSVTYQHTDRDRIISSCVFVGEVRPLLAEEATHVNLTARDGMMQRRSSHARFVAALDIRSAFEEKFH